jgi:orotate phosphoribosyltransferase
MHEIAKILLQLKAVHLNVEEKFTWTSGIESPIYCDNRKMFSHPEAREIVVNAFCDEIKKYNPDVIAGTATAGIPWASFIAQKLNLPLIYVRSKAKGHGLQNMIEGDYENFKKVVLIEDLISTGKSSIAAAKALKDSKLDVLQTIAIFTYGFEFVPNLFDAEGLKFVTLSNLTALLEVAKETKLLSPEGVEEVKAWKKSVTL